MSATATPAPTATLRPSREAQQLARHMTGADGVHRTILEETLTSAEQGQQREAGRTACGSTDHLRRPHGRYPTAVELSECPAVGAAGIWHTHVTRDELRRPEHSLPDWGNVVFGHVDVSIVTGTRELEVITAADDGDAMVRAFQDALGVEVTSKRGLMAAVVTGKIGAYDDALRRVQTAMAPLIRRQSVSFHDLDGRIDAAPETPDRRGPRRAHAHGHGCRQVQEAISPDVANLRRDARQAGDTFVRLAQEIAERSVDEALGVVVAFLVRDYLRDRMIL